MEWLTLKVFVTCLQSDCFFKQWRARERGREEEVTQKEWSHPPHKANPGANTTLREKSASKKLSQQKNQGWDTEPAAEEKKSQILWSSASYAVILIYKGRKQREVTRKENNCCYRCGVPHPDKRMDLYGSLLRLNSIQASAHCA